ncbi:MAG TPA: SDR family oxidoreductase [Propionibacteriaceae bacterium]
MLNTFDLDGVALVTGAASGIGRAIAIGLAQAGADVGLLDRPGGDFAGTVAGIKAAGRRTVVLPADVTHPDELTAAVSRLETELGPLSLAVNAAGIASAAPAETMSLEQWQGLYDVNVTGLFSSCQAEATAMLTHGRGSIVNVASMSARIVNRGLQQAHYNSSKAAVKNLTMSLALEWADRGIRVNSLSPGYTRTPMSSRPEMVDQMRRFAADTPMQRIGEPEEMVGPTVFLLSSAASFVTGVDLLVDGGFCCW